MSDLATKLTEAGQAHRGTDLGGLLQWAALHIVDQDLALADAREELAREIKDHEVLKVAFAHATASVEIALAALRKPICPEIDLGRDLAGHINLMASHGDPDYLMASGKSIRHVDLRTAKPRKAKDAG